MSSPIDYNAEHHELNPSLTRDSSNYNKLIEVLHTPLLKQQEQLLWLKDNICNLNIAEKWHLDFIGRLVGQDRFLFNFNQTPYFGFEGSYQSETLSTIENPELGGYWNNFTNYQDATSRRLSDEEYRRVIKARIIKNNSNCSLDDFVEVVNLLTGRNDAVVTLIRHGLLRLRATDDNGLLTYFFDRIDKEDDILPIPYGVAINLEDMEEGNTPDFGDWVITNSEVICEL